MPRYLSADTIQGAVRRLGESRAQSRLTEYLIVRRTLHLGGDAGTVTLSQRDANFMTALRQFTAVDGTDEPFFSPFGWTRDTSRTGYKSQKYPSNGPSVTVQGWNGIPNTPTERIPNTRPAQIRLIDRTPDELSEFFLLTSADIPLPRAIDVAYWWFRITDIDQRFGGNPSDDDLVEAMLEDLGLQSDEAAALFDLSQDSMDEQ